MSTTTFIVVVTILCCLNGSILAVSVDGSAWIDALKHEARGHRESALSQSEYDVDNSEPNQGQAKDEMKREEWMGSFSDERPNYADESNFLGDTDMTASLQRKADTSPDAEVKQLKAQLEEQKQAIEKQKTEMESMMQQIDALVVQQSKTLSLVNKGKSNSGPQIGLQAVKESTVVTEVITTGGVTYVRWGRDSCPPEVFTLYRGYVAGSHYTAAAGGSNTLCLHDDPQFGNSANSGSGNYIYGTEYLFANAPFSPANNNGQSLQYQDAVCVVCHTPIRSSQIMIPGRHQCPTGWTFEYKGYLVSNFGYTYTRGDYICLDEAPDAKVGGQGNQAQSYLNPVRAHCGSLSCPKYIQGADVVCVVCTK